MADRLLLPAGASPGTTLPSPTSSKVSACSPPQSNTATTAGCAATTPPNIPAGAEVRGTAAVHVVGATFTFSIDVTLVEIEEDAAFNEIQDESSAGDDHGAHLERPGERLEGPRLAPDFRPTRSDLLCRREELRRRSVAPVLHVRTAGE